MPGRNHSPTDLAYLAGIIDGEGTIEARFNRRHGAGSDTNLSLVITVGNTDWRLICWLTEHFGGRVYAYERSPHRRLYSWRISIRGERLLVEALLPYLLLKRDQVETAFELAALCQGTRGVGRCIDADNAQRRRELVAHVKFLKRQSHNPDAMGDIDVPRP